MPLPSQIDPFARNAYDVPIMGGSNGYLNYLQPANTPLGGALPAVGQASGMTGSVFGQAGMSNPQGAINYGAAASPFGRQFGLTPEAAAAIYEQTTARNRAQNQLYDQQAAQSHAAYAQNTSQLMGGTGNSVMPYGVLNPQSSGGAGGAGGMNTGTDAYLQAQLSAFNRSQEAADRARQGTGQAAAQLYGQFSQEYQNARRANEARYGEILSGSRARYQQGAANDASVGQGYQNRYQTAMNTLGGISDQERQDINRRYDQQGASTTQSAISRGLHNTTVLDSLHRGVETDRSAELRREADQRAQRDVGYQTGLQGDQLQAQERAGANQAQLSGDTLGFMERRQDEYPDLNMLSSLALQAGAGGAPVQGGISSGYQSTQYQPGPGGAAAFGGGAGTPSAGQPPVQQQYPGASQQQQPGQPTQQQSGWNQLGSQQYAHSTPYDPNAMGGAGNQLYTGNSGGQSYSQLYGGYNSQTANYLNPLSGQPAGAVPGQTTQPNRVFNPHGVGAGRYVTPEVRAQQVAAQARQQARPGVASTLMNQAVRANPQYAQSYGALRSRYGI